MRTIAILTGSRAEYRYLRPVARLIAKTDGLDYSLIVTNQHLLPEFGNTVQEIERDGLKIGHRLYMSVDGYTPETMCKSLCIFGLGLTDILMNSRPDVLMVVGDRGEHLMGAMIGAHLGLPVAHIQAGERSGNIDGSTRHAIARYAHVHFAANQDAVDRLIRSGEQEFRVVLAGAPQLDDLIFGEFAPARAVAEALQLDLGKPVILFTMHSVTEEYSATAGHVAEALRAVARLGFQTIVMIPNNDAGHDAVMKAIAEIPQTCFRIERNLPDFIHAGLLRVASVMVGNSSSGIIEAPALRLPVVNIGSRQRDRFRGRNVIDVEPEETAIIAGIRQALRPEFRAGLDTPGSDPYLGDGRVAERMVNTLKNLVIDDRLLKKQISY